MSQEPRHPYLHRHASSGRRYEQTAQSHLDRRHVLQENDPRSRHERFFTTSTVDIAADDDDYDNYNTNNHNHNHNNHNNDGTYQQIPWGVERSEDLEQSTSDDVDARDRRIPFRESSEDLHAVDADVAYGVFNPRYHPLPPHNTARTESEEVAIREEEEEEESEVDNDENDENDEDEDENEDDEIEDDLERVEIVSLEALTERMKSTFSMDVVGLGSSGAAAAVWSVSSAKHNSGVRCLLDWANRMTYWQSDGPLPHTVRIELQRLTAVETVCVLLCHSDDESYTPKRLLVRAGTHAGDMAEVASGSVAMPHGWVLLEVGGNGNTRGRFSRRREKIKNGGEAMMEEECRVWCTRLEVAFVENHDNGRDCHVRGLRVLGPSTVSAYTEPDFTQHLVLR